MNFFIFSSGADLDTQALRANILASVKNKGFLKFVSYAGKRRYNSQQQEGPVAPQQPGHPLSGSQKPQFADLGLERCMTEVDEVKQSILVP